VWAQVKSKPLPELSDLEAVLHVFQYLMHLDQRMFGKAVHAAEQALKANPNFAWAWAGRAQLHLAEYCFSASPDERDHCASATDCLRNAMNADPACAYAHLVSGMSLLMQGRMDEMVAASQKAIDLAEGAPAEVGSAGVVLSMAGGEPDGQRHIDQSLAINPRLPGYVRYGTVVNRLRAGAYGVGLRECGQFSMPNCFWDPMLRTAMLVRTGEPEAARVEWSRAVACQPELAARPREFIGRVIRDHRVLDDLADAVCSINAR
jgi:tetratricopeptide (TPR) repeat protein